MRMIEWSVENPRSYPWRNPEATTYEKVIAELLLQRTQAKTISEYFETFISQFPTWQSIVEIDTTALEDTLKPIGLYKRRATVFKQLASHY